jgi:diguanylate cyclase (GGDEF)-like protein
MIDQNVDPGTSGHPPSRLETVRREMSGRFARRLAMSVKSSFIGYGLQSFLLAGLVPGNYLWPWVAAMVVGEIVNGTLAHSLLRSVNQPARRERLAVLSVFGLSFTGVVWGSVILLPGVRDSVDVLMLQETILAVTGVMSIQNLSFLPACLLAFGAGMAAPTLWASLVDHSIPLALGLAAIALVALGQVYGFMTRKLVRESIDAHLLAERTAARLKTSNEALVRAMHDLDRLASLDHLTQCLNRRAMIREIERECSRSERQGTTFGLIMLDLDHFKSVNDRWGHAAGDMVLTSIASALAGQLRPTDVLARWGGEEFLCLLTDVDDGTLFQKAESMRRLIENTPIRIAGDTINMTISLGVVIASSRTRSIEELVDAADKALYLAKTNGRNRVCAIAGAEPTGDPESGRRGTGREPP